jgi:hypothetical protein
VVARAGRLDAEFFLGLGGERKLARAERLEQLAAAHLRNAARLRAEGVIEQAEADALGIVVHSGEQ